MHDLAASRSRVWWIAGRVYRHRLRDRPGDYCRTSVTYKMSPESQYAYHTLQRPGVYVDSAFKGRAGKRMRTQGKVARTGLERRPMCGTGNRGPGTASRRVWES